MATESVVINLEVDSGQSVQSLSQLEQELSNINSQTNELRETNAQFRQELLNLEQTYKEIPKTSLSARKQMKDDIDQLKFAIKDNNAVLQQFGVDKAKLNESIASVDKLSNVIKDIKNNTNINNVDAQFTKLNATIDKGGNSAEDLAKAIKSYQTIALTAGRTSPIGQEALQRASALRDELGDLANEVNNLANDHKNLQGAMELGQGITAGYQAFAGVQALVGVESEALMQTMVKLQAIQSVSSGIMQVKVALEKESSAMMLLQTAKTKALTTATLLYNIVVGATTGAMKLLRLALIATGLGAIVVLIGTLIANWDKWKDSIMSFINTALAPMINLLRSLGLVESENAKIQREATEQRKENIKQEIKAIEEQREVVGQRYDFEIAKARATGKETYEIEKAKLKAVIESVDAQMKKQLELAQMNSFIFASEVANLNELYKANEKNKQDLELMELTHNTKILDEGKKVNDKRIEEEKKTTDKLLEFKRRFQDLSVSLIEDSAQRELMALDLKHQREKEQLILQYGEKTELLKQLTRIQEQERLNAINEIQAEQKVKDDEALEEKKNKESTYQTFVSDMFKKSSEEIALSTEQRDSAILESKQALFNATSSAVGGMINLMGQQSQAGKALALTQLAIDTAMGFANGLRIAQQGAIGTGPAAPYTMPIFYATQIGAVLSAVGKAKSILGAGGGSISAPSTSISSSTTTTQPTDSGSTTITRQNEGNTDYVNNNPNKVVLVESEVNAMRMRINRVNNLATI